MSVVSGAWGDYEKWDEALRELVYNERAAFQPVHLDIEGELLIEAASRAGIGRVTEAQAEKALAAIVRGTLCLGTGGAHQSVLSGHRTHLDRWQWRRSRSGVDREQAPPIIALLAVFSRAADLMGRDEQYGAAAYFPRLNALLDIPIADQSRLQTSFRNESERFWGALNHWLMDMEGMRGVPTAFAIGPRYVGIPMSQALIRQADRQKLVTFFEEMNLEPGLQMSASDMAEYLGIWLGAKNGQPRGSMAMRSLWKSQTGRVLLTEAAAQGLLQWDGSISEPTGARTTRPPVLTARIVRRVLGKARLNVSFALVGSMVGSHAIARNWEVTSAPGNGGLLVEMEELGERYVCPIGIVENADSATLISGRLSLRPLAADHDQLRGLVERRPKPVVVLALMEDTGLYVEVEHVRLGEPHFVLVNSSATTPAGRPRFDLDALLPQIAQTGFVKIEELDGLPEGWVLYRNVVVMKRHDHDAIALEPLRPSQSSVLTLSNGLRMPGRAKRWSRRVPLSVHGVATGAFTSVQLFGDSDGDGDGESAVHKWSGGDTGIAGSTAEVQLDDGVYRLDLRSSSSTSQISLQTLSFTLCSSDHPRLRLVQGLFGYAPVAGSGLPPEISARWLDANDNVYLDASATRTEVARTTSDALQTPSPVWWTTVSAVRTGPATLSQPAPPDSCAITGSHHEQIEQHHKGMRWNKGECQGCGLIRWYRPKAQKKAEASQRKLMTTTPALAHLGRVEERPPITGSDLLDALTWLGGGTPSELAHIVRQSDDSALAVDEVIRALETLAHIDVSRSLNSLAVEEWEMAPRSLAELAAGGWLLTGAWSESAFDLATAAVSRLGGVLASDDMDWVPTRVVRDLDDCGMASIASECDATLMPRSGEQLMKTLGSLSVVCDQLPRVDIAGVYDAEWFNIADAQWTAVASIGQPGAYRVKRGFVSTYYYRNVDDLAPGTAARVTPQLGKHLAAGASGKPLIGYDEHAKTLFVPLGADLPGLYGRALALMSGRPPARVEGQSLLAYHEVPSTSAALLHFLLKG